jgi:hypothetical protein
MENEVVETQDIDKLEMFVDSADRLVKVGEKVMSDGEVNWMDAMHAPELIEAGIDFTKALIAYKEMFEEVKDIDSAELAKLGALLLGK